MTTIRLYFRRRMGHLIRISWQVGITTRWQARRISHLQLKCSFSHLLQLEHQWTRTGLWTRILSTFIWAAENNRPLLYWHSGLFAIDHYSSHQLTYLVHIAETSASGVVVFRKIQIFWHARSVCSLSVYFCSFSIVMQLHYTKVPA